MIRKYAEAGDHSKVVADVSGSNRHMEYPLITIRGEAVLTLEEWEEFVNSLHHLYREKHKEMKEAKQND